MSTALAPDLVSRVRDALPSDAQVRRITDLVGLLADPTRARIAYALLEGDEMRVSELAEAVGASDSATSHALRLLRTGGVVRNQREGRSIAYRLTDDHVRSLLVVLREHVGHEGSSS